MRVQSGICHQEQTARMRAAAARGKIQFRIARIRDPLDHRSMKVSVGKFDGRINRIDYAELRRMFRLGFAKSRANGWVTGNNAVRGETWGTADSR